MPRAFCGRETFTTCRDFDTPDSHKLKHETEATTYHAWAAAYRLDPKTDLLPPATGKAVPDHILALPDRIQGMAVTANSVVLSQSYGRNKTSTLPHYNRPDLAGQRQIAGRPDGM
jgi:hypothetical protein